MESVDVSYGPSVSTRHQVLLKYITALKLLRSKAEKSYNLRPFAFDNLVFFHYFQHGRYSTSELSISDTSGIQNLSPTIFLKRELLNHILDRRRKISYWLFSLVLAILCIYVYRHESSSSVAERGVRSMVYPGMRMWRRMTLPLIARFPRLTELYDETCLMGNPFFQIDDINCSPCSRVKSVMELTSMFKTENAFNKSVPAKTFINKLIPADYVPFVFKVSQAPIVLQDVYNMYLNNQDIFERDAYRVYSTNRDVTNLDELFNLFNQTIKRETHNLWRCNRMLPARLLRNLISRPSTLPSSLVLERYMALDTPQAQSYTLPNTECSNVYIQQALGIRFIILRPTGECRNSCRTLSIRLPQSYVLNYSSWYWKPISAPDPVSDSLSISVIGSYCMRTYDSIRRILEFVPGKKRFGLYRFLPAFFCLGAALEYSMINWTVGETNFYRTFKRRQAKNYVEEKLNGRFVG